MLSKTNWSFGIAMCRKIVTFEPETPASQNIFQNPVRKAACCQIENFAANSEKKLLDLAANQPKWQHWSEALLISIPSAISY